MDKYDPRHHEQFRFHESLACHALPKYTCFQSMSFLENYITYLHLGSSMKVSNEKTFLEVDLMERTCVWNPM